MKPHKCPVCNGSGERWEYPDGASTSCSLSVFVCRACKGHGIVWELTAVEAMGAFGFWDNEADEVWNGV